MGEANPSPVTLKLQSVTRLAPSKLDCDQDIEAIRTLLIRTMPTRKVQELEFMKLSRSTAYEIVKPVHTLTLNASYHPIAVSHEMNRDEETDKPPVLCSLRLP